MDTGDFSSKSTIKGKTWLAVLSTIFGFPPMGIVAVVHAYAMRKHLRRGDVVAAATCSNRVDTWAGIAFGMQVVALVLYVLGHTGLLDLRKP